MTRRLQGKVAIVFGAGSVGPGWGNGKATAVLYARHGATVPYATAEEMIAARDAACAKGPIGTAWDIAHAALFLASDEAQHITGLSMPVDGGLSCQAA